MKLPENPSLGLTKEVDIRANKIKEITAPKNILILTFGNFLLIKTYTPTSAKNNNTKEENVPNK